MLLWNFSCANTHTSFVGGAIKKPTAAVIGTPVSTSRTHRWTANCTAVHDFCWVSYKKPSCCVSQRLPLCELATESYVSSRGAPAVLLLDFCRILIARLHHIFLFHQQVGHHASVSRMPAGSGSRYRNAGMTFFHQKTASSKCWCYCCCTTVK